MPPSGSRPDSSLPSTSRPASRRVSGSPRGLARARPRPSDSVILAEGAFGDHSAKTAFGVLRYGSREVVGVIDSTKAPAFVGDFRAIPGRSQVPVLASLEEALALPAPPDALLIGIAPTGGRLPDAWRAHPADGHRPRPGHHLGPAHLPHGRSRPRRRSHDRRRDAPGRPPPVGAADHRQGAAARSGQAGRSWPWARTAPWARCPRCWSSGRPPWRPAISASFVATGQTGIMIEGWGAPVDAVVSDFVQGTVERIVEQGE